MQPYDWSQFLSFYGDSRETANRWQVALATSEAARVALMYLHGATPQTLLDFVSLMPSWLAAETAELSTDGSTFTPTYIAKVSHTVVTALYTPLRWRCEYLQRRGSPREGWTSTRNDKDTQEAVWDHVKKQTQACHPNANTVAQPSQLSHLISGSAA